MTDREQYQEAHDFLCNVFWPWIHDNVWPENNPKQSLDEARAEYLKNMDVYIRDFSKTRLSSITSDRLTDAFPADLLDRAKHSLDVVHKFEAEPWTRAVGLKEY